MDKKFVRMICRERGVETIEYDIMLEAVLDGDKMLAMPWFGTASYPEGKYPFQLDMKGRADFGCAYEDTDRYWATTLRSKAIRPGELFSVIDTDKTEYMYVIREVGVILRGKLGSADISNFELGDGSELDLDDPDVGFALNMAKKD